MITEGDKAAWIAWAEQKADAFLGKAQFPPAPILTDAHVDERFKAWDAAHPERCGASTRR